MSDYSLCLTCIHVKIIRNERGSTFYLCQKSRTDPAFAKYPHQPVVTCSGYVEEQLNTG